MDVLSFWSARVGYYFVLTAVSAPFFWLAIAITGALEGTEVLAIWRFFLVISLLGWLLAVGWLSNRAASRKVFHGDDFGQALQSAFGEARLYLAFLPVVGRVFAYKRKD